VCTVAGGARALRRSPYGVLKYEGLPCRLAYRVALPLLPPGLKGVHFVQEDSPDEIGRAGVCWIETLG
jgi:hypothetical protein